MTGRCEFSATAPWGVYLLLIQPNLCRSLMGNVPTPEALTVRWAEVVADRTLRDLPYKIELNAWGKIEMSPARQPARPASGQDSVRAYTAASGWRSHHGVFRANAILACVCRTSPGLHPSSWTYTERSRRFRLPQKSASRSSRHRTPRMRSRRRQRPTLRPEPERSGRSPRTEQSGISITSGERRKSQFAIDDRLAPRPKALALGTSALGRRLPLPSWS